MTNIIINDDDNLIFGFNEYCELEITVDHIRKLSTEMMDFSHYDYEYTSNVLLQSCLLLMRRFDELKASKKKISIN